MGAPPEPATKNPGGLAGRTGADKRSGWDHEQAKSYSIPAVLS